MEGYVFCEMCLMAERIKTYPQTQKETKSDKRDKLKVRYGKKKIQRA